MLNTKNIPVPIAENVINKKNFENIFNQLYSPLCRYAYAIIKDEAIAEDIVQEQFIYLWENRNHIVVRSFSDYLFKAVKNKIYNYFKSTYYKNCQEAGKTDLLVQGINYTEDRINGQELQQLIIKAIEQLPPRCSAIFCMKRFEVLTNREVAERLSVSEKTVENQMTIAIRKMAEFLRLHWGEIGVLLLPFLLLMR